METLPEIGWGMVGVKNALASRQTIFILLQRQRLAFEQSRMAAPRPQRCHCISLPGAAIRSDFIEALTALLGALQQEKNGKGSHTTQPGYQQHSL